MILGVSVAAIVERFGERRFVALPGEEIERHFATVEVLATKGDTSRGPAVAPLVAFAAVHHNYTWVIACGPPPTIGRCVALPAHGDPPLFLDETMHTQAARAHEEAIDPASLSQWRLAGLIPDDHAVGLVYVGRLKRRPTLGDGDRRRLTSSAELLAQRHDYDDWSRILIDHLDAL